MLARLWSRIATLVARRRVEREMDEEWRFHLDCRVEALIASGLERDAAVRQATAEFGPAVKWKEESREAHGLSLLDDLQRDTAYAIRQLRRAPGFTLAAITTLAVGIGATTAIGTIVNAILVRPLPFENADRLVRVVDVLASDNQAAARQTPSALELGELEELQARVRTLARVGVYAGSTLTLTGRGDPSRLVATRMSGAFFRMLGDRPLLGRTFDTADEDSNSSSVVVVSFGVWQRLLGGTSDVLGQPLTLGSRDPGK